MTIGSSADRAEALPRERRSRGKREMPAVRCNDRDSVPPAVDPQAEAAAPLSPTAPPDRSECLRRRRTSAAVRFRVEISQPRFALVTVKLSRGRRSSEPSAMASMIPHHARRLQGRRRDFGRAAAASLIINVHAAGAQARSLRRRPARRRRPHRPGGASSQRRFVLHGEGVDLTGKWQGGGFFIRPRPAQGVRKRRPVLQFLRDPPGRRPTSTSSHGLHRRL